MGIYMCLPMLWLLKIDRFYWERRSSYPLLCSTLSQNFSGPSSRTHPPGSINLYFSLFSCKNLGNPTALVALGIWPILLNSSLYVYASGNIPNRSRPSQIVFWIQVAVFV